MYVYIYIYIYISFTYNCIIVCAMKRFGEIKQCQKNTFGQKLLQDRIFTIE